MGIFKEAAEALEGAIDQGREQLRDWLDDGEGNTAQAGGFSYDPDEARRLQAASMATREGIFNEAEARKIERFLRGEDSKAG